MKPAKIRAAKALLQKRKIKRPSAMKLAKAAAELGKGLAETLAFIIRLRQGPQNQPAQRKELLTKIAEAGE